MERRFVLFLVLSFALLFGHMTLRGWLNGPRQQGPPQDGPEAEQPGPPEGGKPPEGQPEKPEPNAAAEKPPKPEAAPEEQPGPPPPVAGKAIARQFGTLGSADPDSPYRMLVAWDNKGAVLGRIELSSPRYSDLEDRSGYLGHLMIDRSAIGKNTRGKGCPVQIVGPGTPAAEAGLEAGDLITALDEETIGGVEDLRRVLRTTRPKRSVTLKLLRAGREIACEATLKRRPLEVIRPEADDSRSFPLTLYQITGADIEDVSLADGDQDGSLEIGEELPGLDLRSGNWEVREADRQHVVFGRVLPKWNLEIVKSYRLEEVPDESIQDPDYKAYHLLLDVSIRNLGESERSVAYQLDGPTGLPAEGAWYAHKISRSWGGIGLRDVVVAWDGSDPKLVGCSKIARDDVDGLPWRDHAIDYIGVDAQYFSCVLLPQRDDGSVRLPPTEDPTELWFAQSQPLRVGTVDEKRLNVTNTSCRLVSQIYRLAPAADRDDTLSHRFVVFAGPKKPSLLAQYDGLGELVYYGWFGAIARPMSGLLHFFYGIVHNYGLAILMLTVLVRGLMFPLSRKQALGARKMQELQPEIKRLQEKYKNDMEGRTKAQQELFRKHNYNPFSGCLVLFVQFPVFIALYRSLMVDIELRQAPLLWEGLRWCSNLSAPDMLFDWSGFMPAFITSGRGFLGLGPYFNILPVLTVVLFIMQQKMFMPPATDEKVAQQQKIMQYMMIFIGLMFFKVASGLCVYFIASSLWGLAERKFLPKSTPVASSVKPATRADAKAREKARAKPAVPAQSPSNGDGVAARRKKAKRGKR